MNEVSSSSRWPGLLPHWGDGKVRFTTLLAAILILFVVDALLGLLRLESDSILARILSVGFLITLLASAAFAVDTSRKTRVVVRGLTVLTVAVFGLRLMFHGLIISVATHLIGIVFFVFTVVLILRHLIRATEVDYETICASLCGFLMLGMLWSLAYSLIYTLDPGAFRVPEGERLSMLGPSAVNVHYFSYVTLTTLGFGDITPVSHPARILTILEAMAGQIFLVVLVARLVGLQVAAGAADDSATKP